MSAAKFILASGCLALVTSTGFFLWCRHASDAAGEQLRQSRVETVSLRRQLAKAESELRDAEVELTRIQPVTTKVSTRAEVPAESRGKIDHQKRMDTQVDLQVARMKLLRAALPARYSPFFRRHQLSAEAIAKFQDNYLKYEGEKNDLGATQRSQGYAYNDPAIQTLRDKAERDYNAAQLQVLGQDAFKDLLEYERTTPIREYVGGVVGNAAAHGIAFSKDESEQLVSVLSANSPSFARGGRAETAEIDWESVDRQAGLFLKGPQLDALRNFSSIGPNFTDSRAMSQLNEAITRAAQAEAAAKAAGNSSR